MAVSARNATTCGTRQTGQVLLLCLLLGSCSGNPSYTAPSRFHPLPDEPRFSSADHTPAGDWVAELAMRLVGTPYRYGGTSPRRGFDCSGLVAYTHHQAGVAVPRSANNQYLYAKPVARSRLRPGDLVFFALPGRRNLHVGIYTGGGRFVHAPRPGRRVHSASLAEPYWSAHYLGGGRYLP